MLLCVLWGPSVDATDVFVMDFDGNEKVGVLCRVSRERHGARMAA
jgi:hypothetical protein